MVRNLTPDQKAKIIALYSKKESLHTISKKIKKSFNCRITPSRIRQNLNLEVSTRTIRRILFNQGLKVESQGRSLN